MTAAPALGAPSDAAGAGRNVAHDTAGAGPAVPGDAAVTVFRTSLDLPPQSIAALTPLLSPDEMARAARYRFDRDRRRFIVGRGLLRHLLRGLLGRPPSSILFARGPHGKPTLVDAELPFNFSASGDEALCAIDRSGPVGVDIEVHRPLEDLLELAHAQFEPEAAAWLSALPAPERLRAFFDLWTAKEAVLKALGVGLTGGLKEPAIDLGPGTIRFAPDSPHAGRAWTLAPIPIREGVSAALAVPRAGATFRLVVWPQPEPA